jgi:DNA-binding XRE family transcriptional regulator
MSGALMTGSKKADKRFSGDLLRSFREKAGMTQLALAVAIDVTPGTIHNWESGKATPDAKGLMKIKTVLRLNAIDDLYQ